MSPPSRFRMATTSSAEVWLAGTLASVGVGLVDMMDISMQMRISDERSGGGASAKHDGTSYGKVRSTSFKHLTSLMECG